MAKWVSYLITDPKHKVTKRHIKIVAKLTERFKRIVVNSQEIYVPDAEKMVNDILELCCVNESQSRKLIDKKHLNVSGDGTKLKVHSNSIEPLLKGYSSERRITSSSLSLFRTRSKERELFYGLLSAIAVHIDIWVRQDEAKKAA